MTHKFKVGDKGKTRGGDDYEVTAVGETVLLAKIYLPAKSHNFLEESTYTLAGKRVTGGKVYDLLPPKRRIQGSIEVREDKDGSLVYKCGLNGASEYKGIKFHALKRVCNIPFDVEEGGGLEENEKS